MVPCKMPFDSSRPVNIRRRFLRARCNLDFTAASSASVVLAMSSKDISSKSAKISASRWSGGSIRMAFAIISTRSLCTRSIGKHTNDSSSRASYDRSSRQRVRIRLRTIPSRKARTAPRLGSYAPGLRQRAKKHSCTTSSAAELDPVILYANRYKTPLCQWNASRNSGSVILQSSLRQPTKGFGLLFFFCTDDLDLVLNRGSI
jgi:hypothetical protein